MKTKLTRSSLSVTLVLILLVVCVSAIGAFCIAPDVDVTDAAAGIVRVYIMIDGVEGGPSNLSTIQWSTDTGYNGSISPSAADTSFVSQLATDEDGNLIDITGYRLTHNYNALPDGTFNTVTWKITARNGQIFQKTFKHEQGYGEFVNMHQTDRVDPGYNPVIKIAVPAGTNFSYDGKSHVGVPSGTGYALTGNYYAAAVGNYTAVATLQSGYQWIDGTAGPKYISWSINAAVLNAAYAVIAMPSPTYTGGVLTPIPTSFYYGGNALVYGRDYVVNSLNSINAGTGYVSITGIGSYTGSFTQSFTISRAAQPSLSFGNTPTEVTFGNSLDVSLGGVIEGGGITYSVVAGTSGGRISGNTYTPAKAGWATIRASVAATANYAAATKDITITVNPMSIAGAAFASIGNQVYTGGAIAPEPAVTLGGKTLAKGVDFVYSYSSNINKGSVTVTVTGQGNYNGTAATAFEIIAKNIAEVAASALPAVTYKNGAFEPDPVLTYNGLTLSVNNDYKLTYSNNKDAGEAAVTVTGQGNYNGVLTLHFTINKAEQTFAPRGGAITFSVLDGSVSIVLDGTASTAATTYAVSDGRVASVNKTSGKLTAGNRVGTTTVTITNPGDNNYKSRTQSVSVTTSIANGFFIGNLSGDNTVYPSLQDAINASANGGTVYVKGSPALSGTTSVSGKNVTLKGDGDDAALSRNGYSGSMLSVASDAGLTIEKLKFNGAGVSGEPLIVSLGNLTLDSGAQFVGGKAANGGAVNASAGTLTINQGASFLSNAATDKGGAVYVAAGVTASIFGGVMSNNRAATAGNGIWVEGGSLLLDGTDATVDISDSIGLGDNAAIKVKDALTHKVNVAFPRISGADDVRLGNVYVSGDHLTSQQLKDNFRVSNPGYTFLPVKDSAHGELQLIKSATVVAVIKKADGTYVNYTDLQEAINAAVSGDTILIAKYTNELDTGLNTREVTLSQTVNIPAGKDIKLGSVEVTAYETFPDSGNMDFSYNEAVGVTLKRANDFTGEMLRVEQGGKLTLGKVTLDGGAVWDGGSPTVDDDKKGGAGTAVTNNSGAKAHAPVVVNRGTLTLGEGATIKNNDNNYVVPGESSFGSQNYGGGVRNEGNGRFAMTGGTIQNCYSREGGAVMNVNKPTLSGYVEGGNPTVTISGGEISGNISQMKGAAVQTIYGGAQTIVTDGAVVTGNKSLHDLGTLSVEEGGKLTVSGGTVAAGGGNKNAVYIYNKYGAENYDVNSKSKPFIERKGAAQFTLSGNPTLGAQSAGGNIFLDNPCYVVNPDGTPSDVHYNPVVELKSYSGAAVNVKLDANRPYGDTVVSDANNLETKVNVEEPSFDTDYAEAHRYFYTSHDGGKYTVKYGGYDFDIDQTKPGILEVNGVCDTAIGSIAVTVGGKVHTLKVTKDETTGKCEISGEIDLTQADGVSFDATVKASDASGSALSDGFKVMLNAVKFNPETGEVTAPEEAKYLDGNGVKNTLKNGTLPNDIAIDEQGYAKFIVDETEREIYLGERADEITEEELPLTGGALEDLTNTIVTIAGKEGYEYNLIDKNGDCVGVWKSAENVGSDGNGTVVFEGLAKGEEYTVAVRKPSVVSEEPGVGRIPGVYEVTDKKATTLTDEETAAKKKFEDEYDRIKDTLLKKDEGGAIIGEPTAASGGIDAVRDLYDAIAEIGQVADLPGIREKIDHLNESYDHAAANEWKSKHEGILTKDEGDLSIDNNDDKTAADAAIDDYETLTDGAKQLAADEYKKLVENKKAIAVLEVEKAAEIWTAAPHHGDADEIAKIVGEYLTKIGERNESTEDVKAEVDLLTKQALAALEVRGKYDDLLADNSDFVDAGGKTLADLLGDKLTAIAVAADDAVEGVKDAANAEILLLWQKESAKYEYQDAFDKINGRLPISSETDEAFGSIDEAADLSNINSALGGGVKTLLENLFNKDSDATRALITAAQGEADAAVSAADAATSVADMTSAADTIRADVQAQRAVEKKAAQVDLDNRAQEILKKLSDDARSEADALIADAKRQIDDGFFADYPLISEKALLKLELLQRCDEIVFPAEGKGWTGTQDVAAIKDAALADIDAADGSAAAQSEKEEGMLKLNREGGVLTLKNYLTADDSQEVKDLVVGVDGAETQLDAAADTTQIAEIVSGTVNAIDAGRFKDEHKMRKPFIKISEADLKPLTETKNEYDRLTDAVKDVLDKEAQDDGYSDYGKYVEDCIGKAEVETKKSEVIDAATSLVREHDGERVRTILEAQVDLIEAIEYQPHTDDSTRDDYIDELKETAGDLFAPARVEIEHSQKQQRTENQLVKDLEEKLDSGQYNDAQKEKLEELLEDAKDVINGINSDESAALDGVLEGVSDALGNVPVESVATGDIKPDKRPAKPNGTGDYDDGDADEVWGIVSNDASMPGGVKLVIDKTDSDVLKVIKEAAKEGKFSAAEGSEFTADELVPLVDGKEIKSSLDIYLLKDNTKITEFDGKYLVKILLTPELRSMVGLQVVYVDDDGAVQVYKTTIEDGKYLVFTTAHFSEFYIMGEKEFNLWWLIIVFAVLIVIEAVVIFLLAKRKKGDGGKKSGGKPVRLNSFALPLLLAAAVIVPNGAVAACATLGALAVAGGGVITALVVKGPLRKPKVDVGRSQAHGAAVAAAVPSQISVAVSAAAAAPQPAPIIVPVAAKKAAVVPIIIPVVVPSASEQKRIIIQYRRSFTAKLVQSEQVVKGYYSDLKNEIMSYGVKSRISWRGETFRLGKKLVRIHFRGHMLALGFDLSASDYADTKYKVEDASDIATSRDLPCVYRIRNARRAAYAKDLIADVMAAAGLAKIKDPDVDYKAKFPYEGDAPLIARGLIKVLTEEPSQSGTTFKKEAAVASVSVSQAATLMRDEAAAALVEEGSRIADKTKSDIVNVDTLGRYFEDGETVTLAEMKKRIPALSKKTTYVKILARGTLDKALNVEADDFSLDAVKMILLTGGKVIRSGRA